ncbi:SLBB domain-containing protein [Chitinophaga agri]|uniref:Capsule biosynthesis protein n=1 Tax=Chitinophaga agri TaxID=2703787 RepID=A0A6B9ZIU9_9BACT|nr:SLBB domain-containing protein [Chitinophaga agri]QHS61986.1 capsule biosynthesis protein [Chitinophaga agri]
MSPSQMSQIKVDNLSDDQIRQLVAQMKQNNVSYSQIDGYASQRGIPDAEVVKLKARINQLNLDTELASPTTNDAGKITDGADRAYNDSADTIRNPQDSERERRRKRIFGSELFGNKNLTFEPNLRMPTPANYKIAADDELIIDVYGYSEVQHSLKVTPEGYIRIPYLGPVYVNGLTMEEARTRITKQLSTIYGGIKEGNTSVQVSLGNIRSIRITIIGEIMRPGTYTLPSLATVANALYVSGGPSENGSFRDIDVIRNGKRVATFDLYDFLLNGDLKNNIVLQEQDVVKVSPYKLRVELEGEVKRPAIFDVKNNESLQTVIEFAGGFTDNSYKDVIRALRVNSKSRELVNIPYDSLTSFKVRSGDKFVIDSIARRYTNRVSIAGAVFHPGEYALEDGMTVKDLIGRADGILEIAATTRGLIRRLQDDYTPAFINFNVADVVSGKTSVKLQREDSVVIFSKLSIREPYVVKIQGEVNQPGYFSYGDSMRLEDLILMAGGLKDAASLKHVEIARRIRTSGSYDSADVRMSITEQFDISADLAGNAAGNYILQPFDEITVRRSPSYNQQLNISLEGQVVYPGNYTITTKRERISDVIKRAGGLRPEASAEGALLLRRTYSTESDSTFLLRKLEIFNNTVEDSLAAAKTRAAIQRNQQLLGIQLEEIMAHPGSKYDFYLEEGDVIRIPKKLQTVQLFGEIYFPKKVRYDNSVSFRTYIRNAGGFTSQALKRRSYVVFANGEVKSTKRLLFFNKYPKVKPGAEIYVPTKPERKGLTAAATVGFASALASLALVVVTIINTTK